MPNIFARYMSLGRKIGRYVLLFFVLRFGVGIAAIAIFDRDAIAWGPELTLIAGAAALACFGAALAVRRYAPPHRTS